MSKAKLLNKEMNKTMRVMFKEKREIDSKIDKVF